MSLRFFGRGYTSRGESSSPKFSVGLLKKMGKRRSDRFRFFFLEGGWQKEVRSILQGGTDTLKDITMDFPKVIYYEIVIKQTFISQQTYLYTYMDHRYFEVL